MNNGMLFIHLQWWGTYIYTYIYTYSIATNTLYLNQNVHHEEFEEVRRCNEEEEQESGVYDPSNLTVIYESDDSNIETL